MPTALTDQDRAERIARLRVVAGEIDRLIREIAPLALRLTHLRAEAQAISREVGDA